MSALIKKPSTSDLARYGQKMQEQIAHEPPSRTGVPFLRLLRSGQWVYGQDNTPVEDHSEWAINPLSIEHGVVSWAPEEAPKAEILGEIMVPYGEGYADPGDAPGRAWQRQMAATFQCLNGEDEGTEVLYKGTSLGLTDAFAEFVPQIASRLAAGDPHCVPVVQLGVDDYPHPKWGTIYKPDIVIVRWVDFDGNVAAAEQLEAPPFEADEEPQPQRRRRRAAA